MKKDVDRYQVAWYSIDKKKEGVDNMELEHYEVVIEMDGKGYVYGIYNDRKRANEIALQVREERSVPVSVYEVS